MHKLPKVTALNLDAAVAPEWREPQPLTAKIDPDPYPIDALPDPIRAAVEEVYGFVQAPLPLVAASALSAMSLVIQAHYDVERASTLDSPTGGFFLTIGASGERKSTVDKLFIQPVHDYENAQVEAAKPEIKKYKADIESWESKRSGIKDRIRIDAKNGKPTASHEAELRDLEHEKPEPLQIPRLLYADATPEALAYGLAKEWPSGGVISAEAGIVFGSHSMGQESIMRNFALLNQLWDGVSVRIDRKSVESFKLNGARLTIGLQVQPETLNNFLEKSGALARGIGFMARFLISCPESTQGIRFFTEPPDNWPSLTLFNQRITEILNTPAPINEDGVLTPQMLTLSPEAKALWIEFHDGIECQLASGGALFDVRDVASKTADNATRVAALFHVFNGGVGPVSKDAFERARTIVAWHLNESRRFFGEIVLPQEIADAVKLDGYLVKCCRDNQTHIVDKSKVFQCGPNQLRNKSRLDPAIEELRNLDRIKMCDDGDKIILKVNPALLPATPANSANPANDIEK